MFAAAFVTLALSASALANVFITNPVGSTVWTAGQTVNITWQDDGSSPTLASFGPAKISVYVGNAQQQTSIVQISPSTDVSTTGSLSFVPDANLGPSSSDYFIRVESLSLKDTTNSAYPALAFSAKFAMTGMSGSFNPAELAQIAGQSTAPLASQSTTVSLPSSSAAATSAKASTTSAASGSKTASTSASATSTSNSSGARGTAAISGFAALAGLAVAVFGSAL